MTDKRVTAILYGCDRNLWNGGPLQIRVTDLFAQGGPRLLSEGTTDASTVELGLDVPFDAGQVYAVSLSAPKHRPAWQLIRRLDFIRATDQVEGDDLILRLMLVPDSPGTTDLPKGLGRLEQSASPFAAPGSGVSANKFEPLDTAAKMAFLNIEAKLRETIIDGAPLMSFVRGVSHVAVDRVFLYFDPALKARMPRARDFAGAAGHGSPKGLDLPAHPDSWKHTRFAEGNVQLSFSEEAVPLPGRGSSTLVHSADVDIDLGRGLAHAQEWLVNNVFKPGHKTNQALVYALLYAQGILPRYTLDPAPETTARSMARLMPARAPQTLARKTRARKTRLRNASTTPRRSPRRRSAR